MTPLLRRPILVGGLGLTLSVWLLESLHPVLLDFGGLVVWATIALGSGIWWLKQRPNRAVPVLKLPTAVDQSMVDRAFATVAARIEQLASELKAADAPVVVQLEQQLAAVKAQLNRQEVQLAVMGSRFVGKTTVLRSIYSNQQDSQPAGGQVETSSAAAPSVLVAAVPQEEEADLENADLILFVTAGDLTESEFQSVCHLRQRHHRVVVVFNKQDQYLPSDRPVILQQLRQRVQGLIAPEDVVAVSAQPAPIKVRQHQPDGSVQERLDQPPPDLAALQVRLKQILSSEAPALIRATTLRQAEALHVRVQVELNQVRRTQALPAIEQYQWVAAAAAFANPVPSLDLLATAAINAQMVMDLGTVYQQSFSLEQAKTVAGQMASQMVKLGLVEMASQAIAPLLKSHALTYVAGGMLQGISAAYLTRLAGLSLVEYFEEQSQVLDTTAKPSFQIERLIQKLKAVFQENQRSAFLQQLVKQGISRLVPQTAASAS
ncbi:MAG: DUF697 domain-containing protein [Synechococcales cyanobacterium C42_A2020_086]|nr:DUF697 domain-containing protein [Synechococcales cyanobacterium C42_A2020_086]